MNGGGKMGIPNKLQAARYKIAKDFAPYLSTLLWSMSLVEVKDMIAKGAGGLIGVDKYHRIYYDPSILDYTVPHIATLLMHETQHLLRQYFQRFATAHKIISNIAADIVINECLLSEGREFPIEGICTADKFKLPKGQVDEWYYQELMKKAQANAKKAGKLGQDCQKGSWELGPPEATGKGNEENGVGEVENQLLIQQTMKEIAQHRGTVPGDLKRLAEEFLKPKVDWRQQLTRVIRGNFSDKAGQMDYSYCRPSRRQTGGGVILPSLRKPSPKLAIVADTSGSMGNVKGPILQQVVGEVDGILQACGVRDGVPFYATDSDVAAKGRVFSAKQLNLSGGGGTDMRVGIAAAMQGKPLPDMVIVLSDGYTPWPDRPLGKTKLLAVIINGNGEGMPEWMTRIMINVD
jgi:predicted metal-dependent peptidase